MALIANIASIPLVLALGSPLALISQFGSQFLIVFLLILVGIYVYISFAYMAIAKKASAEHAGIVWIPVIGPALLSARIAKMHWWPIFLPLGVFIPFLNIICITLLVVFFFIWTWKTFEAIEKPGWWVLLSLIPIVGNIIFLVLLGIAAWSKK